MIARDVRLYVSAESWFYQLWRSLRAAGEGAYKDNCFGIAKGAAYSGLLSFFPLLTTVAAVLVQVRADSVSNTVTSFLFEVVPPGAEDAVRNAFVVHGQRPTTLLVAAVALAAWAASGVITSLMEGFRSIYHIPSGRGFVRDRAMAIQLVFIAVVPLWLASALIVFGGRGQVWLLQKLPLFADADELSGWVLFLGLVLRYTVAFGSMVLVTACVYYFGPNRKQLFRQVLPGAALATVLWLIATLVVGWYIRHVSNYNVLYGSVGAGLALLVWMYVLAVIMLFGCEFNAVREYGDVNPS